MVAMSDREVVVVSRPYEPEGDSLSLARDLAASTVGLVVYSTPTAVALTEATMYRRRIGPRQTVPAIADAIISRIDLTDIVVRQVDATIILRALDEIDITQIMIDQWIPMRSSERPTRRRDRPDAADRGLHHRGDRPSTDHRDICRPRRLHHHPRFGYRADEIISTMVDTVLLGRLRQRERNHGSILTPAPTPVRKKKRPKSLGDDVFQQYRDYDARDRSSWKPSRCRRRYQGDRLGSSSGRSPLSWTSFSSASSWCSCG